MPNPHSNTKERTRTQFREPLKYNVWIYNDDFTPMDFVVLLLMKVFRKTEMDAMQLMLKVHHSEKAVAGSYSLDIAKSKAAQATVLARQNGYPLRVEVDLSLPF